jgi:U3 small nucleolar ribonucleoprotein component
MAYGVSHENKKKIEQKLIQPKDWFLKGEVKAKDRPKEQLLD